MKYNEKNKPLVCMMTQSTCYKGTKPFIPLGVLWHSTGANNPNLKRYVQPDDKAANKQELLKILGTNTNHNDWNHITRQAGLNCWIGKFADGTVGTVQTMPWNYRPWGCGSGSKGSCNDGWIQFEICEDNLGDKKYFEAVYKEACEITAYLCKMFKLNPKGTVKKNGVDVPVILCHKDSANLKMGSDHADIYHWFKKYGKDMTTVRNDVYKLMNPTPAPAPKPTPTPKVENIDVKYQVWDDKLNKWLPNVVNNKDFAGNLGNAVCAVYASLSKGNIIYKVHEKGGKWLPAVKNRTDYAGNFNKPIDGLMMKTDCGKKIYYQVHIKGGSWLPYVTGYSEKDSKNGYAGNLGKVIDGIRIYVK